MADDTAQPASEPTPETSPEPTPAAEPEAPQPATESLAEQASAPTPEPKPESMADPDPEPTPEPQGQPAMAATLEVPPLDSGASQASAEGGEWELLVEKLRSWLASGQLQRVWQQTRSPLTALGLLLAAVLVLRVYAALLGAIEDLPLVPGLLELIGLIWLLRFGAPKLVRSQERNQMITTLRQRWQAFRGQR